MNSEQYEIMHEVIGLILDKAEIKGIRDEYNMVEIVLSRDEKFENELDSLFREYVSEDKEHPEYNYNCPKGTEDEKAELLKELYYLEYVCPETRIEEINEVKDKLARLEK